MFRASDDPEMSYIVNNAEKFGITIIHMSKSSDGGSKGKDREKKYLQQSKDCIRIISDSNGNFLSRTISSGLRLSGSMLLLHCLQSLFQR